MIGALQVGERLACAISPAVRGACAVGPVISHLQSAGPGRRAAETGFSLASAGRPAGSRILQTLPCDEDGEWRKLTRGARDEGQSGAAHVFAFDLFLGEM